MSKVLTENRLSHSGPLPQMAALLAENNATANLEASRLMMPFIVGLNDDLNEHGSGQFFDWVTELYRAYDAPVMKEIVTAAVSEILNQPEVRKRIPIDERLVDFFVLISQRHVQRTLDFMIRKVRTSCFQKVLWYQNLRMGGMYPPMEDEMRRLLAAAGYPVADVELGGPADEEPNFPKLLEAAEKFRTSPAFQKAKIILARFKISSAPNPDDSLHPESFVSPASQREKIWALAALAGVRLVNGKLLSDFPIVMVDASKNTKSLAHTYVTEPFVETFNALDFMDFEFCHQHLYWLARYGFDNIDEILPASYPGGPQGRLYQMYAYKMARAIAEAGLERTPQRKEAA